MLREIKKYKAEEGVSSNLVLPISDLANKMLDQLKPEIKIEKKETGFFSKDTPLLEAFSDLEYNIERFKHRPVQLIIKIHFISQALQQKKISRYSAIAPVINFLQEVQDLYLINFLSKISEFKKQYRVVSQKEKRIETYRKVYQLLSEAIQLSAFDCSYSQNLIFIFFAHFKDIKDVYIAQSFEADCGWIPSIYYAAELNLFDIIPFLKEHKADPNALYRGETYLHKLIEKDECSPTQIDFFLGMGANLNSKSLMYLTPVEKSIVLNKPISQYFQKKGFFPLWKSEFKISLLQSLYQKIEFYIIDQFKKFKQSKKSSFTILNAETHNNFDSLIVKIILINICYRLGIKTYYLEENFSQINFFSADINFPIPKSSESFFQMLHLLIAQEYEMKIICVDDARTYTPLDASLEGMKTRDQTMAENIIKKGRYGLVDIGGSHLKGISSILNKYGFYSCNINADTCHLTEEKEKWDEQTQFCFDESKCLQAYLSERVTASKDTMLFMQNLIWNGMKGRKMVPMLIEEKIFKNDSINCG